MFKYLGLISLVLFLVTDASPKEGQKLSDYLWEQTDRYQQQALDTNIIHGVREYCLNPSEFGGFMVDDSAFSYEVMKSFQIAAKRSGSNETVHKFLESEANLWKSSWEFLHDVWHIKKTEGIKVGKAASTYMDHIRNVAITEHPVYTILALIPCIKLWPWLGEQIGSGTKDFGVYTSWVEESFDPSTLDYLKYQDYIEWAYESGIITAERALEIFTDSMQNEVTFFNSVSRCQPRQDR